LAANSLTSKAVAINQTQAVGKERQEGNNSLPEDVRYTGN